jgi:hypothetical protein
LAKSYEKREESKAWEMYLTKFPNMTKENYISFNDFWNGVKNRQPEQEKTVDEIREEFNEIRKIHQGRGKL